MQMGLTVEQVAGQLLVSPSKISRLETGQRGASARDIRDLSDLYRLSDADKRLLAGLAAESKQQAWWQPLNLPYSTYVGLEADAVSIRDFALGTVPGLLQTAEYARVSMRTSYLHWSEGVMERRLEARMERQARVLGAGTPSFNALVDESVLHRVVESRTVMAAQLRSMHEASYLPAVTIRIVPFGAGALPAATNKFIILSFGRPTMPDVVYLESLTGELILDHEEDLTVYNDAYRTLDSMAASVEDTRDMLDSYALDYAR
jgi:transcriptional regulator with XRE-family HTH domain